MTNEKICREHDCLPGSAHPLFRYNVFLDPIFDCDSKPKDFETEYKQHKAMEFNVLLTMSVICGLHFCILIRWSMATLQLVQPTVVFYLSSLMFIVSAITGYTVIFSRPPIRRYVNGITILKEFHIWAFNLNNSRRGDNLENVYILSFTAAFALFMFGHTLVGDCPEGNPVCAAQQSGIPLATSRTIPLDSYVLTMIAPLVPQIFLKGASRWAIVWSLIVCVFFVNASHAVVGVTLDMYIRTNTALAGLMMISYEHERMQLIAFLMKLRCDEDAERHTKTINELSKARLRMMAHDAYKAELNVLRARSAVYNQPVDLQ